jgi:hypothetical protein
MWCVVLHCGAARCAVALWLQVGVFAAVQDSTLYRNVGVVAPLALSSSNTDVYLVK